MAQDKIIVRGAWILPAYAGFEIQISDLLQGAYSPRLVPDFKSGTSKGIGNVRHSKHGTPEDIF